MRIPLTAALWLLCSCVGLPLLAQTGTVKGYVRDAADGETLIGATVVVAGTGTGTTTNAYGFYSLTLPIGEHRIAYQYVGYETLEKTVRLTEDTRLDFELGTGAVEMAEVVVTAEEADRNVSANNGSAVRIDVKALKELPSFGGEPDIVRAAQFSPSVKQGGDGNAGYYVRGGGLDQNLILLDEAPVYNPSHLLGFFSVFNGDALRDATLYTGGMSAEYGGRTASVMDIHMRDGNKRGFDVTGGLGLIASRLTVEGPIQKDKSSFMISGRRTYADLFVRQTEAGEGTRLYFYDVNAKLNFRLGDKDRLFVSGYTGRDAFGFDDAFGLDWGNLTGVVRWNHLFSDRLFSNTSFIVSDYDYEFSFGNAETFLGVQSVVRDFNLKQDFTWFANPRSTLKFGVNVIDHTVEPGNISSGEARPITAEDVEHSFGYEGAAYVQHEFKVTDRLSANYGLRYSLFQRRGPGDVLTLSDNGEVMSAEPTGDGEEIAFYDGWEPRLSLNYRLDEQSALKLGFNRNFQYLHLLVNATASTPADRWIMSSNNIAPQSANQVSLGYFRNLRDNAFELSAEAYYKDMDNVIDYRTGAETFFNDQLEADLVFGDGRAYGLELAFAKTKGRLTGQLAYTLSKTERRFDEINDGAWFSARQDRTHDISLLASYGLTDRLTLAGTFTYYTGDAVTFPSGRYRVDNQVVPYYTERNGYRMPDYHRLDLAVTLDGKPKPRVEDSWNFSLFNAYGRENAFAINFEPTEENPRVTEAVQVSLFRWVPSVTYNFKF